MYRLRDSWPNCKEVSLFGHKWLWRLIVMDSKVPDEEEMKNPAKKKSSSGSHNPLLIHAHPLQK